MTTSLVAVSKKVGNPPGRLLNMEYKFDAMCLGKQHDN